MAAWWGSWVVGACGSRSQNEGDERGERAGTFGGYLSELGRSPQRAQQVLLTRYEGHLVDSNRAAREVRFEPNAPEELPNGFKRSGIYVLKMPCCTCTQTLYTDSAGDTIAIFEHPGEQQDWFGSRPTVMAQCHGKQTSLVQVRDQLAATWKCGRRYLTVVGARDIEQVGEIVAFLDQHGQANTTEDGAT